MDYYEEYHLESFKFLSDQNTLPLTGNNSIKLLNFIIHWHILS